jgi:ankyrin repeat protein
MMHKLAIAGVVTGLLIIAAPYCSSAYGDQNQELPEAAMTGSLKQGQSLLDQGINVNAKDKHGVTALWLASKFNHPEVVRLLLEKGADANTKDSYGVTALIEAASFTPSGGKSEVMRPLLEEGSGCQCEG